MRSALLILVITLGSAAAEMVQKLDEASLAEMVAKANGQWNQFTQGRHATEQRLRRRRAVKAVARALLCSSYSNNTASMIEIPGGTGLAQVNLEESLKAKQLEGFSPGAVSDSVLAVLCRHKDYGGDHYYEYNGEHAAMHDAHHEDAGYHHEHYHDAQFNEDFGDHGDYHHDAHGDTHHEAGHPADHLDTNTKHAGWYPNHEEEYYYPAPHNEEEPEQYYYEHAVHPTVDHWKLEEKGLDKIPPNVMTMAQNPRRTDTKTCNPTGVGAQLLIRCCSFNVRELVVPMASVATATMTYEEAMGKCQAGGYRLCTLNEMLDGRGCGHDGCGSADATADPNPTLVWTSTPCEAVGAGADNFKGPTVPPPEGHLTEKQLRMFMDGLKNKQADLTKDLHELIHKADQLKAASLNLPFELNPKTRTVELNDWNLAIYSSSRQPGTGNFVVGLGNSAKKADNSFVAGEGNVADGESVTVAGGWNNIAKGHFSAILGGKANTVDNGYTVVAGGVNNTAERDGAVISGGSSNIANGEAGVVSGGFENIATGAFSQVGGGFRNTAVGESSTVAGGTRNTATGQAASVSSGSDQVAAGEQYR